MIARKLTCGLVAIAFSLCFVGCGDSHIQSLERPAWTPKIAEWPELKEINSGCDGSNLQRAFRRAGGDVPFPQWFNDQKFVDALQKFETTPIPAVYQSPDREAEKTEIVTLIKKLQQASTGKSTMKPKEVGTTLTKIRDAYARIIYIPDQKAPEGEEAKKYSTIMQPAPPPPTKAAETKK